MVTIITHHDRPEKNSGSHRFQRVLASGGEVRLRVGAGLWVGVAPATRTRRSTAVPFARIVRHSGSVLRRPGESGAEATGRSAQRSRSPALSRSVGNRTG